MLYNEKIIKVGFFFCKPFQKYIPEKMREIKPQQLPLSCFCDLEITMISHWFF